MTSVGAVVLSLVLAWLIVAALSKPKKKWFSALLVKGKDGSVAVKLWPARKRNRGRKR